MSHINFVCQVLYPDSQATSQLFSSLMEKLAANGHDIHVYCGYPNDPVLREGCVKYDTHAGLRITRCGWKLSGKKSLWARALVYLSFLIEVLFRLLFAPRGRLNFGVTNPPFVVWCFWLVRKLKGAPYVFMLLDVHPEGIIAEGMLKAEGVPARIWRALNRWAYRSARQLVILGRDMREVLIQQYGIESSRIEYVPHWSAVEMPAPLAIRESKFWHSWALDGKFVVQYSGNMGLWHDMETFVHAAALLKSERDIQFIFIGGGMREGPAKARASELGCDNIVWKPFVALDELAHSLSACHVALLSLKNHLKGVAVPCKFYGILASGRAVLALVPTDSEIDMTIREHQCGEVLEPGDAPGLAEAILRLRNDAILVKRLSANAFAAYRGHYTLDQAEQAFDRLLN
jgi:colanic acid biosynthesis glycosyl transferase WcaI